MDKALTDAYLAHGVAMGENLRERMQVRQDMEKYEDYALTMKAIALKDIFEFFRLHLWTHDPRRNMQELYGWKSTTLPFVLYDYQKLAIEKYCWAIDNGKDVLTEKSRDMGVSWLLVCVALWYFLQPEGGNDICIGSRKFEYVDKKGAIDTLLEKFRYNLYRIPDVFMPIGYEANKHDNVGNITNPDTGSFIRGEANNANFATSGRYKFIIVDEFAKWEETDEKAWTSMGDSSPCRLPVSTPWGMGRKFAKLRFSGEIEVISFHWSEHPIKGSGKYKGPHPIFTEKHDSWLSPWYLTEVERRKGNPNADIGQELDIDYLSSGFPYFNNIKVQECYKELDDKKLKFKRYEFVRNQSDEGDDYLELFPTDAGRIWVYKEFEDGWENRYCIAADIAEGMEHGDNSVFVGYDRVDGVDVCGFCGKLDTDAFAMLLEMFGRMYGDCYIAPENNSMGVAVVQRLKQNYDNIYHQQKFDQVIDLETTKLGWNTNRANRGIMFDGLREAINDGSHGIVDKQVFKECTTFVLINGKPQADTGNKDDMVVAQAIKFRLHDWLPAPERLELIEDQYAGIKSFAGAMISEDKKDRRVFW